MNDFNKIFYDRRQYSSLEPVNFRFPIILNNNMQGARISGRHVTFTPRHLMYDLEEM
jgi:hypothetical protein